MQTKFTVLTYNQASHQIEPEIYLFYSREEAEQERDRLREDTTACGRGEVHVVAEVDLHEDDDGE